MARKPRDPYARAVDRAIGGPLRHRVSTTHVPQTTSRLSRKEVLDCIAAEYQKLDNALLVPMNQLRGMNGHLVGREVATGGILQPALTALAAKGLHPQDGRVGSFLRMTRLSPKDMRWALVFDGESSVAAKRVAGRFRARKPH